MIECASEPWYNLYFNQEYIAPKLSSETFGLLTKSCAAFFCVGILGYGTFGFGLSQIAYALAYSFVMLSYMKSFQTYLKTNSTSNALHRIFSLVTSIGFESYYFHYVCCPFFFLDSTSILLDRCATSSNHKQHRIVFVWSLWTR